MDNNDVDYKIVFIIAHRYTRGYESYLKYYINNILSFYKNPLIIAVDNNSKHKDDIFDDIKNIDNVILLDNYIKCKFELGAYQVGFRYLLDNKYDNIVNATNLQVGAGCIGSLIYLIRSIKNKKFGGLLKPEDLSIKDFINLTKPLLGDFIFKKIDDWTYQKNNNIRKHKFSDFTIV